MSNIGCTFALEIGKVLKYSAPETDRATLGSDPRGIRRSKTHTADVRKKSEDPLPISGFSLFDLQLIMKPTFILLWEIIFDVMHSAWCSLLKTKSNRDYVGA